MHGICDRSVQWARSRHQFSSGTQPTACNCFICCGAVLAENVPVALRSGFGTYFATPYQASASNMFCGEAFLIKWHDHMPDCICLIQSFCALLGSGTAVILYCKMHLIPSKKTCADPQRSA